MSATQADADTPPLVEVVHGALAAAWRRRRVILVPALALPIVGFGIGLVAPRTYEAKMSLIVQDIGRASPDLQDISVSTDLKNRIDSLKALLASKRVLLAVAGDMHFVGAGATDKERDLVVDKLARSVEVNLVGTDMLQFSYRASSPHGMSATLNRIAQRFMESVLAPEASGSTESVSFLKRQLDAAEGQLADAEDKVGEFKGRNVQQLPDQRGSAVARLATLRDQLADHESQLAGARGEFEGLRSRIAATDPVVGRLEQDIVSATSELANLKARYTESYSGVQAAERRLDHLEEMRRTVLARASDRAAGDAAHKPGEPDQAYMDKLWNMAATTPEGHGADGDGAPMLVSQVVALQAAKGKVDQLRAETENIRQAVATIERQLASSGQIERELRELERDLDTKTNLVAEMSKRYERAQVSSDLTRYQAPDRVKVVDPPSDPDVPLHPVTLLFTLAGIFGGLAFGIGLAVAMEIVDPAIRRTRDMARVAGAPVLARLGPLAP